MVTNIAVKKPTAAEVLSELERLAKILADHPVILANRQSELDTLMGEDGLEALENPEKISNEIVRLQATIDITERAIRGARGRLRKIAPIVLEDVERLHGLSNAMQQKNAEDIKRHLRNKLREYFGPDKLEFAILRSLLLNSEFAFQANNQPWCGLNMVMCGDGTDTVGPNVGAMDVIMAHRRAAEIFAATTARTEELKRTLK